MRWPHSAPDDAPRDPLLVAPRYAPPPPRDDGWHRALYSTQDLGPVEGEEVVLVRFARLEVGGNLDRLGEEELRLCLTYAGRSVELLTHPGLHLPFDRLATYEVERAPYLVLPPARVHELTLSLTELDLLREEPVTQTRSPIKVRSADLPLDQEVVLEEPGHPLGRLPGLTPRFALAFVRTRLRGPDDASRQGLRQHLGFLLATPPPDEYAHGLQVALELAGVLHRVGLGVACSTHTHLRTAHARVIEALQPAVFALKRLERDAYHDLRVDRAGLRRVAAELSRAPEADDVAELVRRLEAAAGEPNVGVAQPEAEAALALVPADLAPVAGAAPEEEQRRTRLQRCAHELRVFLQGCRAARAARDRWAATDRAETARGWAAARALLEAELGLRPAPARPAAPQDPGLAPAPPEPAPPPQSWSLQWPRQEAGATPREPLVAHSGELPPRVADWNLRLATHDLAPPAGKQVVYMRLVRFTLAGKSGKGLRLQATHFPGQPGGGATGTTLDLLRGDLPLSQQLQPFELERSPFLALPWAAEHCLDLAVLAGDGAEVTRTLSPLRVEVSQLQRDRPVGVTQAGRDLRRMRGEGPKTPSFELAFLRVRARERDEASRWGLRRHLGFLLATPAPRTIAEAASAQRELPAALGRARMALACSTHTHLRAAGGRVLEPLESALERLVLASRLEGRDLDRARHRAGQAAKPLARLPEWDEARALASLLERCAAAQSLPDLRQACAAARDLHVTPQAGGPPRSSVGPALEALEDLEEQVRSRQPAWDAARGELTRAWPAAREVLEAELR